jgi:predicted enzyme related to lactoylglutathione lyase
MIQTVAIERVAHTGIRVRDLDRALAFYRVLGFTLSRRAEGDDVAIIRTRKASKSTSSSMPMPVTPRRTS